MARGRVLPWSAPRAAPWWSRLVSALTHQHDHVTLVERAIVSVMGEDFLVATRRCPCGHETQTVAPR